MEKNIKAFEGCERELEIIVSNSELEPYFDKEYKEIQPTVELKGFRKGKVPIKLIKQFYGKKIEKDLLHDISQDLLNDIIKEDNLKIVGEPRFKSADKTPEGAIFKIVYETIPEFELQDYRSLQLDEPVHNVNDEEIDEYLEDLSLEWVPRTC